MSSIGLIFSTFSLITCIGLALFVFSRNSKHIVNRSFSFGMLALAIIEFGNLMVSVSSSMASVLFWKRLALVGESLAAPNWLLFSLTFSRSNYPQLLTKWKWVILGVYLITFTFLAFIWSDGFVWALPEQSPGEFLFLGRVGYYFYIFFLLTSLSILVNLESTLRASTAVNRWKIKYTAVGVGAIFAFFIYLSSQYLLFSILNLGFLPAISGVIFISTVLIAFSLVRHRLLDVDVFVSRQVVYRSLAVSIVGVYLLILGLAGQLMRYIGGRESVSLPVLFTFITTLILVIVLLSENVRRKVKLYISQNFYKNKYDYREKWSEFTEGLSSKISLKELLPAIIDLLAKTIWVNYITLWLYDEEKNEFYLAKGMNISETSIKIKGNNSLIRYFKDTGALISTQDLDKDPRLSAIYEENKDFFKETKATVCLPLISGQTLVGLMTLSKELTTGTYTYADYELLKTIANQVASNILIAKLSQESIAAKQMETFHRLSSFVIHDIKNYIYMLSLVLQNATDQRMRDPEFQQDVLKMMSDLVSKMRDLTTKLSATPDKLKLEFKEENLNQLVEEIISKFQLSSYKKVTVVKDLGVVPQIKVDSEQIQNVLMNLLLNAAGAIEEKGEIRVRTSCEDGWITLAVSDNGRGMSREFIENSLFKPFKTTKKNGLGIGLYQCKTIIEAHGGKIEVESEEGKGSTFTIKLPK
ncbi:MAG TPA: XrtA/PEP-CTERM system histidine kinase PrsK [Candidatus Limnocylindrales bacterium]|nr:XrtA/PEP-CTERM system histidine kinase PrsK [Candidatus Limnocylindrales bacterium]